MPDLQKPIRQLEQEIGEVSREIIRIEAHIRRGEGRAASARIDGVRQHLDAMENNAEVALQLAVVGAQIGLFSGGGSWLSGRLPAALLCGVGGWMYGQSMLLSQRRDLQELAEHIDYLEEHLAGDESTTSNGKAETSKQSESTAG